MTANAAGDAIKSQKVPEAASEAASNVTTAVRKAGEHLLRASAIVTVTTSSVCYVF